MRPPRPQAAHREGGALRLPGGHAGEGGQRADRRQVRRTEAHRAQGCVGRCAGGGAHGKGLGVDPLLPRQAENPTLRDPREPGRREGPVGANLKGAMLWGQERTRARSPLKSGDRWGHTHAHVSTRVWAYVPTHAFSTRKYTQTLFTNKRKGPVWVSRLEVHSLLLSRAHPQTLHTLGLPVAGTPRALGPGRRVQLVRLPLQPPPRFRNHSKWRRREAK